jgi:hypothetical protein
MLVRLWEGDLVNNSPCGGPSLAGGSSNLSKILDLASHKAFVTGEWYIPGHRLIGLRPEEPASIATWIGEVGGSICESRSGDLGSIGETEEMDQDKVVKRKGPEVRF